MVNLRRLSPLHSRGWAFQELLLSPRTVYFAGGQIYWDCFSGSAFRIHPGEDEWQAFFRDYFLTSQQRRFASIYRDGDLDLNLSRWNQLIQAYSRCSLIYGSDKLVCMSGVQVARALKPDNYVAGLWRQSLPGSLLWSSTSEAVPAPRYRAPSWSWASVDAEIEPRGPEGRAVAEVSR